jgi:hypothetical protein
MHDREIFRERFMADWFDPAFDTESCVQVA